MTPWHEHLLASPLGLGTMAIGGQYAHIDDAAAHATLTHALERGIRVFDTAPQYGCGLAEERLGRALAMVPRERVVVATKVGKRIAPLGSGGQRQTAIFFPGGHDHEMLFDYSFDGTLRIVEGSLARLGLARLDLVLIHDVIRVFHGEVGVHARFAEARDGAVRALRRLQREGVVGAIGTGLKDVDIAARFIEECGVEVVLVPGRLTLLEQSALTSGLLDLCGRHGTALLAAAPFDSGILATGSQAAGTYGYKPADAIILDRVRAMEVVCARSGVPLQAAALQYPRQFSSVAGVICGMRSATEIDQNLAWSAAPLPAALWDDLALTTGLPMPAPTA
jgi:D-threo-aldose 1-dehydrogenase